MWLKKPQNVLHNSDMHLCLFGILMAHLYIIKNTYNNKQY